MAVVGVGWGTDAEPPEHLIQQPWSERHLVDEGEVRRVPVAPPHLLSERFDRRLHGYRFHGSLDRHLDLHAGLCSRHHRHITGDIDDHQPITSTGPNRTNAVTRAIRGGSPNGDLLRPRRRLAGIAVTIALMGGRWMFLAPSNVGGHTTFAEVIGHGMQPKLYSGDLSISRAQSEYRLGDLVVFKVRLHHRNGYVSHRWSVDPIRLAGRPRATTAPGPTHGRSRLPTSRRATGSKSPGSAQPWHGSGPTHCCSLLSAVRSPCSSIYRSVGVVSLQHLPWCSRPRRRSPAGRGGQVTSTASRSPDP